MKTLFFSILLFAFTWESTAQDVRPSTVDFKIGIGRALLGTGDYGFYRFENEVTKKWTKWFSTSLVLSIGTGYNNQFPIRHINTFHADFNLFVSPFGNQRINNFKIGTGFTVMGANITSSFGRRMIYDEGRKVFITMEDIRSESRRATGVSMIIEDEISVSKRLILGLKILIQPYSNADILSGFVMKFGFKL
ncbi:MAG: hypothetical protein MUE81_06710 [Thermoflexibacter sp.]|jgi:hypothetical protein|nr:hypothetical protein [Thermoflexibacter sp.]